MCVCLSDVGIVIKNRFFNLSSKLQAQNYSYDLLDLCYCELRLVQLFYFSLLRVFQQFF